MEREGFKIDLYKMKYMESKIYLKYTNFGINPPVHISITKKTNLNLQGKEGVLKMWVYWTSGVDVSRDK